MIRGTLIKRCHLLMLTGLVAACAKPVHKFAYHEMIPNGFVKELALNAAPERTLKLVYLGCGNMILEKDGEAVMTDPFFSNQKVLKLAGKIKSDRTAYGLWKKTIGKSIRPSDVKGILVAHTHYDHVMDLPLVLTDNFLPQLQGIYGNAYLPAMFQNFRSKASFQGLTGKDVYDPEQENDTTYRWINLSPSIRFLAIRSGHAPHIGKKLFMSRPLKASYFTKRLKSPDDKIGAFKWTVGETFSFLVDFLGRDTLRVFIQTSASQPPCGFPPARELKRKPVDLAVLCYASAPNVRDYPGELYWQIHPTKVVLVHWEDFFRHPESPSDVKLVRGTDPGKVKKRIDALALPHLMNDWVMPRPGTLITIRY